MAQRVPVGEAGRPPAARVRVAVRLRPYMNKHDEKGEGPCVRGTGPDSLEIINWRNATETLSYQFDVFHGEQTTQQEVFLSSVKTILPHVLNGQNASVFAYGPTGAGKTHTMLGSAAEPGVIPRAVQEVFHLVRLRQRRDDGWDYAVDMSYLEIYNEKVLDLLSPSTLDLPIREDKDRNILVPGLTRTPLDSFSDFDSHFVPASLNRTTASTKLNQRSSRSHAILLIQVVRTQRAPPQRRQTGKLYLVDLAGSEDNRRTGNQGIRLKESGAINLSLFTLSKVVDVLNAGGAGRVPYRDSKLTRLLQDSLGGSAHSVMITNIAPEYHYYFDTFTALNFAAKSKQIVNKPFVRETLAELPPGKRSRDEQEAGSSAEPHKKKLKGGKKRKDEALPRSTHTQSPSEQQSVLDRVIALERMMSGSPEAERLNLLKTIDQSRKEIQELKEQQKALESRAKALGGLSHVDQPLFNNSQLPPLHRKPAAAPKPRRQQAVVQPLQGSSLQPLLNGPLVLNCPPVKKASVCLKKKDKISDPLEGEKENVWDWESQVDGAVLERCGQKILQVLNSGSLKELKALQKIGEKKAQLILGWRQVNGSFAQVEDLTKIDGFGAKTFSSFVKANILSEMAK